MLSPDDVGYVRDHFNIYDHNWAFYEELLGECALIDDVLSYCDGSGLYLCAFSLSSPGIELSSEKIIEYADRASHAFSGSQHRFINIWGRFEDLPITYNGHSGVTFNLCEQSGYYEDAFDSIFDVDEFSNNTTKEATRRLRALSHKNVETSHIICNALSHEHLGLIEKWIKTHDVSNVHKEFICCLRQYVSKRNLFICEARLDGCIVGFSVIGIISDDKMVVQNSFPLRGDGMRIGDALFAAAIQFAKEKGIRWIHRGYSANKTLLEAKEAWGAMRRSLPYREAFYAADAGAASLIKEGTFLWRLRLGNPT